jgi:mannose-6-phosphate isomerase-like protein (cupin superfamily)
MDGQSRPVGDGVAVVIPSGTRHNVINVSKTMALKLYSLYSPPEHKDGTIHKTKKEADADEHHH